MVVVRQLGRPQFIVPRGLKKPGLVDLWQQQDRLILELGRRRGMADEARDAQDTAEIEAAIGVDPPWEELTGEEEEDEDDEDDDDDGGDDDRNGGADTAQNEDGQDGPGEEGGRGGGGDEETGPDGKGDGDAEGSSSKEGDDVAEGDEEHKEGDAVAVDDASTKSTGPTALHQSKAPPDATAPAQHATHDTPIINPATVEPEASLNRTGPTSKPAPIINPSGPDEKEDRVGDNDTDMAEVQDDDIAYPTIPDMKTDLKAWGVPRHGARVTDTLRPIWLAAYRARVARGAPVDGSTRPVAKKPTEAGKLAQQGIDTDLGGPKSDVIDGRLKIKKRSLIVKLKCKVPATTEPSPQKRKRSDVANERPAKRLKDTGTDLAAVVEGTALPQQTAQQDADVAMGGTEVDAAVAQPGLMTDVVMAEPQVTAPVIVKVQATSKVDVPQTRKANSKRSMTTTIVEPATVVPSKSKITTTKEPKQLTPEGTRKSSRLNKNSLKMTELPTLDEGEETDIDSQALQTKPIEQKGKVADDAVQQAMLAAVRLKFPEKTSLEVLYNELGWITKKPDKKPLDHLSDIEAGLVAPPEDNDEFVYTSCGTHVVGAYACDPHPLDHLIPTYRLNAFEQWQRQDIQRKAARKEAADKGVPFEEPPPPEKPYDWREHPRKPGEVRRIGRYDANRKLLNRKGGSGGK